MLLNKLWVALSAWGIIVGVAGCAAVVSDSDPVQQDRRQGGDQILSEPAWSDMHFASMQHDGLQREYYFYDPRLDGSSDVATLRGARPLLLVLHGGGSHARNVMQRSSLATIAREEGFVVAFPNGIAAGPLGLFRTWNAGACCNPAMKKEIDDVGFIQSLIRQMIQQRDIDSRRVFVTGFSNGGLLSYQLACALPGSFAAIAPVASVLPTAAQCGSAHGTALIAFHGRKDKRVRYKGRDYRDGTRRPSVTESVNRWATINECKDVGEERFSGYQVERFSGCRAAVELYSIDELGHRWPGWDRRLWWGKHDSQTSLSVDASRVMWAFFESLAASPR